MLENNFTRGNETAKRYPDPKSPSMDSPKVYRWPFSGASGFPEALAPISLSIAVNTCQVDPSTLALWFSSGYCEDPGIYRKCFEKKHKLLYRTRQHHYHRHHFNEVARSTREAWCWRHTQMRKMCPCVCLLNPNWGEHWWSSEHLQDD